MEMERNIIQMVLDERKRLEKLSEILDEDLKNISASYTHGQIMLFEDGEGLAWYMHKESPTGELYVYNLDGIGWALDLRKA